MPGPLEGLTVVEIGDLGEVAGKLLADAGARVIRVEPPAGAGTRRVGPFVGDVEADYRSLSFAYLNTNKQSLAIDIESSEGADIWRRLVQTADAVIDAAGFGALEGRGLGYEALGASTPAIWCAITPFGLTGPWRERPFSDLVHMALGGVVMMCGYDDHEIPPVRPDGAHSLAIAGEYATIGIISALWQRLLDGQGHLLDVSIHESVAGTTEGAFMNWEYLQQNPERRTGRHAGTVEEWQLRSGDGEYLVLFGGGVPRDSRSFAGLLEWMDEFDATGDLHDPAYEAVIYTPPREGGERRARLAAQVAAFVQTRPAEEVYRRGQAIGLPWAPVRRPEQNLDDPHWADRGFWVEAPVPGHSEVVRYPVGPYRFTGTPLQFQHPAPALGQHTLGILEELGYDTAMLASYEQRHPPRDGTPSAT